MDRIRTDDRSTAERALRHLVGALLVLESGGTPLVGAQAGPWCQLLEHVTRQLQQGVAYTIRPLLMSVCEHRKELTDEQIIDTSKASRRLLEFAWSRDRRDRAMVIHALQCVCRTFEGDTISSATLIRRCLEPQHLSQYGFEEIPQLAQEIESLVSPDPGLVEEIYRAAFAHEETSDEDTAIGTSRIMGLISNRKQDYHMALYTLAEAFPLFLKSAPDRATRALIAIVEAYVAQRHPTKTGEIREFAFDYDGVEAVIRTEYSGIWDEGDTYRHDEPVKMLDAFQKYLEGTTVKLDGIESLRQIIRILVTENRLAVFWRRLLIVGAHQPNTVGRELRSLAWAVPILTGFDTAKPAGDFIRSLFPTLDQTDRQHIERTIMSLPTVLGPDGESTRNRLLGCLKESELVTDDARRLLTELKAAKAVPPNEAPFRFESWSGKYTEEDFLRDQGVPVDAEANRRIRELERPIQEFADKHVNSRPTLEEATSLFEVMRELRESLTRASADGVHSEQADYAWGYLCAACGRIAKIDALSCKEPIGALARATLLEISQHQKPVPDPQSDAHFNVFPSWGSPAPRIEAAAGLATLARLPECASPELVDAVERLASDPVPSVRFQVAERLTTLYNTAQDVMWRLLEQTAREESNRGVLQGLVAMPLSQLAGAHPDKVGAMVRVILERTQEGPGAKKVQEFCIGVLAGLYVWRDHATSGKVIVDIVKHSPAHLDEAHHLLAQLRRPLTYGSADSPDPKATAIRHRAIDLLQSLLHSAREGVRALEQRFASVSPTSWPEEDQDKAKSLMRLVDGVASELYFASGAFDRARQPQPTNQRLTTESTRLYSEAASLLDELADEGVPSIAHHVLKTLEFFIPVDSRGVFVRIGRAVRAAQRTGYQYESLAADLIVRLIERYLAEHRLLFREDPECRRILIEVLDIFVEAGWPSARRLTYGLDEIFR